MGLLAGCNTGMPASFMSPAINGDWTFNSLSKGDSACVTISNSAVSAWRPGCQNGSGWAITRSSPAVAQNNRLMLDFEVQENGVVVPYRLDVSLQPDGRFLGTLFIGAEGNRSESVVLVRR
ncbi:MAG: hypothetical protein HUU22_07625 [Phycisphaerae bacterium]|nr:hypothetical protein [Phycisphaerae bacterium]NUQ45887.1 hypothetical protein [Phycisphaerae bacterium]